MADFVCELLSSRADLEAPLFSFGPESGAILDFRGVVREREDGRLIAGIEYEAHASMAQHQLERITFEAIDRFDLNGAVVRHRIGYVPAGEASLVMRLATAHRSEALKAMAWLIDELKKRVPIWKHPRFVSVASETRAMAEKVAR